VSKSLRLARVSAKGGVNILWGLTISSIISAIGVMIVAGILSGEEFGVVAKALIGPSIIITIRDLGIDQATIKYAVQYRTENDKEKLKNIITAGTVFEVVLGTIFTAVSLLLSGFMANILEKPTIVPLIQIASFTILAGALLKAAQSAFIGYEKMKLHSVTLILHSILKSGLMILLVTLRFGVYGATIGNAISYLSAGLISIALLYLTVIKKLQKQKGQLQLVSTLKTMLKFGLPLSIAVMLIGVLSQFYSFLVAIYTTDLLYANYQIALNFAILVSIFASSITTVMFPTFSKVKAQEDPQTLRNVFQYSIKYTTLLIVPLTFAVMVLSKPGVETLFQNKYEYAPFFLSLYVISFLYSAIGNLSVGALIKSQEKTQVNLKITILTFIVGFIISLALIPQFGILGLIATHLTAGMPSLIIALWWINKNYNATIDWKSSTKILTASASSAILTYLILNQLNLASWISLLLGAAVFLGTYMISAPLIGAINYNDTKNLKDMLKSLGPLGTIINPLLYPIEKITSKTRKNERSPVKNE
jgi:O-antigen/teichoic acid export membrane protein